MNQGKVHPDFKNFYDGAELLTLSYESSRSEAFILHGAHQLSQNLPLYPEIGDQVFIFHVYNPLTYLPTGLFGRLFNSDMQAMLFFGRLISYVSTVLLLLFLTWWTRQQNKKWKSAVFVGAAILFYQIPGLTDFYRLRPESPALFFTFTGVILFLTVHPFQYFSIWHYRKILKI